MAHYTTKETRAEATSPDWLRTGAQLGTLVNEWALRSDLVAYVGPGAGGPAPACYNPILAEIEVNVSTAFGAGITPDEIGDLTIRSVQYDWPKASGAIFHEALHARFSRWNIESAITELTDKEFLAINLLEESRIEYHGVATTPDNRAFLRACALEIVLADAEESIASLTSTRAAATLAGLTLARVDAGVLDYADVEPISEVLDKILGEDVVRKLSTIWTRFQMHDKHHDYLPLVPLAQEWVAVVEGLATERGEEETETLSKEMQQLLQEMLDALAESADITAIGSSSDLGDQQTKEEWQEIVSSRSSAAKESKDAKDTASKVFAKGTGPEELTTTRSELIERRKPKPNERAAAVKVAQMLEKAKYRERDAVEISSALPPGRLRTRALVQGAALKSKGIMTDAEPWRRTVRRHTDEPTLTVGVMVDISGSMSAAMQPMAVTAWVMSEAAKRAQARAAMVYYGSDVFPTLKPGQNLTDINVYTAADGTEKFDKAFKALDGSLDMLAGRGARLLVIVSDGHYVYEESEKARHWMKRCQESGVAVLWLPFTKGNAVNICRGTDAVILEGDMDPAGAATEIGKAAATALTRVGQRA